MEGGCAASYDMPSQLNSEPLGGPGMITTP
jgi:hypothetical protein